MCLNPTLPVSIPQPQSAPTSAAKAMGPLQRQKLAVTALAREQTISQLAITHEVSRKFVHQQTSKARLALDEAFASEADDSDQVLFWLPVTKAWLRQFILALVLICHSSYRGVVELLRDLFDSKISLGTVHNIVRQAVAQSRDHNRQQDLSNVRIGAHDEIFQNGRPVLVGADVSSTYCYLLSLEERRDADTWGVRLLELQDQGFHPDTTIADAGAALRSGQAQAMPDTPCRGDVFHALKEITPVVAYLENRAYDAIAARSKLKQQQAQYQRRHECANPQLTPKLHEARQAETQAVLLADDVALLARWLREILAVTGPVHDDRRALYDFVVAELRAREAQCPHRLGPICRWLANQRDDLLAFAVELDQSLTDLAEEFQVSPTVVRELLNVRALALNDSRRWRQEAALRQRLRSRFYPLNDAVEEVARSTVRASSVIENLNSRLRTYFFLRRHLGPEYLTLLQFFLNHRRFLRSEHPGRVGKSPAELLTGHSHPHWLEMLGFTRFSRN